MVGKGANCKYYFKTYKKIIYFFIIEVILLILIVSQICIVFTTSPSVPYSVCLLVYNLKPQKGDLCAFKFKDRRFIKYILGKAGDRISNIQGTIYIGSNKVGKVRNVNNLTPINEGIIPDGYMFVAGTHPDSFDSRYKEFGLIRKANLEGKVYGIVRYK